MSVRHMEFNGIRIDVDRLLELGSAYEKRIRSEEVEFWEAAGEKVDYAKNAEVVDFLFNSPKDANRPGLGLPVLKRSVKTNAPSTEKSVLQRLSLMHPAIDHLLTLKQLIHQKRNFLDGYGNSKGQVLPNITPDGKLHANYRVDGTDTGRLSTARPNIMNIPNDPILKELPNIRSMFIPSPGKVFIESDYSQLELWVIAIMSDDQLMLKHLRSGDMHRQTAAELLYHKPADQITSSERSKAKAVNFGIAYLMGYMSLAYNLRIDPEEAKGILKKWFRGYYRVREMMEAVQEFALSYGYYDTVFGRRRHLPELINQPTYDPKWDSKKQHIMRSIANFPIQSTGSDILSMSTISLVLYPFDDFTATGAQPVMSLHDALYFEVDEDKAEDARLIIKEVMEGVPRELLGDDWALRADAKIVPYWGYDPEEEAKRAARAA